MSLTGFLYNYSSSALEVSATLYSTVGVWKQIIVTDQFHERVYLQQQWNIALQVRVQMRSACHAVYSRRFLAYVIVEKVNWTADPTVHE